MLRALQRFLTLLLLMTVGLYTSYEALRYNWARQLLLPDTLIANLDVGGLSVPDAISKLTDQYYAPIAVYYRQERLELDPREAGFVIDAETMVAEAKAAQDQIDYWDGFLSFLLKRSFDPIVVALQATHDRNMLRARLQTMATFLDKPSTAPQLLSSTGVVQTGESGYQADIDASLPEVEASLYRSENRVVNLIVYDEAAPTLSMDALAENIQKQLEAFSGLGSVFVLDLATGEEIGVNGDVAISGLSILKIAIFVEAYRQLDGPPDEFVQGLFIDTAVHSSNYAANLLLHIVAGEENTYQGAQLLTDSMKRLGLVNTFMAVPYDAKPVASRPSTYITPANSREDLPTSPDPAMQTTAAEMGTLLSMIYYCAQGGGALLAVYPGDITPEECQAIIDLMVLNEEGNLIRFGVPATVPVSHKHGWDFTTQGDAGLVLSPGGDYVIVEYVTLPDSDWLSYEIGFPILREISRATYNYFNREAPNLEDPNVRAEREAAARAVVTATAEAAALATLAAATPITATAVITSNLETAVPPTPTITPTP